MSNISADKIKKLREKTGAGMMDCKTALVENNGDIENSIGWLRKKGISNAEKKSSRIASEGLIGLKVKEDIGVLIEVNTETDFVSKNTDFQEFVNNILNIAVSKVYDLKDLMLENYDNSNDIGASLKSLIAKIGENIVIRRIAYLNKTNSSSFGSYVHNKINNELGKMACIVKIDADSNTNELTDLAKKIAMHITASKPLAIDESLISKDIIKKEKDIYIEQLKSSGKPNNIIEKIVEGKIKKFLSDITLINQNWVLDPSMKVKDVIDNYNKQNNSNIKITNFETFILGEGIEVEEKNFSEEVASQLNNTS